MLKPATELLAEISRDLRIIDAALAREELGDNEGLLIDVREPGEVEALPNPAAVNVPRGLLEFQVPDLAPAPGQPIYLHCASGGRARLGAEQLARLGYSRVTVIGCDAGAVCAVFGA